MPIVDDRTAFLNLRKPFGDNYLQDDVPRLRTSLDLIDSFASALNTTVAGKALLVHQHVMGDTTGLIDALAGKAAVGHVHAFDDLTDVDVAAAANGMFLKRVGGYWVGVTLDAAAAPSLKSYIDTAIANLVNGAPGALDALNELAAAIGNDPNFAATVAAAIGTKLNASAYTAADVLAKLLTVDGPGSGLEADLLAGQNGAFYRNMSNANAGTLADARLPASMANKSFTGEFDVADPTPTFSAVTFQYHQHLSAHVAWYKKAGANAFYWRKTSDGTTTGSGLTELMALSDAGDLAVLGAVAAVSYSGIGSLLTALNAANISSGTLADARLSSEIMKLGTAQTIDGQKRFMTGGNIGANADQVLALQVPSGQVDCFFSLYIPAAYRVNIGLRTDGTVGKGGGSLGAVFYEFVDAQNVTDYLASKITGTGVGSIVMAKKSNSTAYALGATIAGSALNPSNADGSVTGSALSGTWRCLGAVGTSFAGGAGVANWIRIS